MEQILSCWKKLSREENTKEEVEKIMKLLSEDQLPQDSAQILNQNASDGGGSDIIHNPDFKVSGLEKPGRL